MSVTRFRHGWVRYFRSLSLLTVGRRTVSLPEFAITSLGRRQLAQKKAKFAAGSAWVESGLVFTTTIGTALDDLGSKVDQNSMAVPISFWTHGFLFEKFW